MKLATIAALVAVALNVDRILPPGHHVLRFFGTWGVLLLIVLIVLDRNPGGPAGE